MTSDGRQRKDEEPHEEETHRVDQQGESSSHLGDQYSGECGTKQRRELQTRGSKGIGSFKSTLWNEMWQNDANACSRGRRERSCQQSQCIDLPQLQDSHP